MILDINPGAQRPVQAIQQQLQDQNVFQQQQPAQVQPQEQGVFLQGVMLGMLQQQHELIQQQQEIMNYYLSCMKQQHQQQPQQGAQVTSSNNQHPLTHTQPHPFLQQKNFQRA